MSLVEEQENAASPDPAGTDIDIVPLIPDGKESVQNRASHSGTIQCPAEKREILPWAG
jgi:hypothetical protein